MTQYSGIDWLAMALTLVGIYLLGSKSRCGFVVTMASNLCPAVVGLWAQSLPTLLANLGFFGMNVRGLVTWSVPTRD